MYYLLHKQHDENWILIPDDFSARIPIKLKLYWTVQVVNWISPLISIKSQFRIIIR